MSGRGALLGSGLLLLAGCLHRIPPAAELVGRRWQGTVVVTSPCIHGSYTGAPLNICMVATGEDSGWLTFSVDWDAGELRSECDYFQFSGGSYDQRLRLIRSDEPDDQLHLSFRGDTLVGFFQVHPACEPWPVELIRVR